MSFVVYKKKVLTNNNNNSDNIDSNNNSNKKLWQKDQKRKELKAYYVSTKSTVNMCDYSALCPIWKIPSTGIQYPILVYSCLLYSEGGPSVKNALPFITKSSTSV